MSSSDDDDVEFCYGTNEAQDFTWTSPFPTDQVFVTREDMLNWVKTTAYSFGFVINKLRSKKCKNGSIIKYGLVCDRSGKPDGSGSSKKTRSIKTDCPFKLIGKYSFEHHYWKIRVVCDQHNHLPTQHLEGHPYARRLSDDEFRLVEDLTRKNVPPHEILSALKDRDENNLSTLPTIYDAQKKIRKVERAGKTPMQVLMSLLHTNGYVYLPYIHPSTNELLALFFVHPTSYDIWRAFPHVLIIDATYKTNIYNMPFVQIVGVTSTEKTFCVGFVFLSEEKTENYEWALEQLKVILNDCMHPRVIVTDRELALKNACEKVFPHANHLLCRWHISQNLYENCRKKIKPYKDWETFQSMWKLLIDSPTWTSYEENYEELQTFLSKYPRALSYIRDNWLDKYKQHFVSASIDQCLNFGNRTSNRAESQHAKFKKYMHNKNSKLDKFVACINKIVESQLIAIRESFGRSEISRYHHHNIHCFNFLRGFVSKEALDLMVNEMNREDGFPLDSSTCGCQLYNSCGLPCACRLSFYMSSGQCIPLDSIDIFWRTLDISPVKSSQNDGISCDTELNHFKEHFNKQSDAGKRSVLQKLVDIFNPSKTTIKPPPVKKNTRGRPKKQQQQRKHVPPKSSRPGGVSEIDLNVEPERQNPFTNDKQQERKRGFSCKSFDIDLNMQPRRHSSFSNSERDQKHNPIPDLNKEPPRHSSFVNPMLHQLSETENFRRQIPKIFYPYMSSSSIQNVKDDGNCGFRSVALGLGYYEDYWPTIRRDLVHELEYRQNEYTCMFGTKDYRTLFDTVSIARRWMIMPITGLVIASKYNKVVVSLADDGGCTTCFPLWSSPLQSDSPEIIVIAHVNGNHYIRLALREGFPLPRTHPMWDAYKNDIASGWGDRYVSRQDDFINYYRRDSVHYDLG